MDLISVVIVNWNGKKWLSKCLASLVAQTYQSLEVILVDNGSTDGSLQLVADFFPHVRVITRSTNDGFAIGNTVGIEAARGSMILLLNNDAWVEPSFVQEMHQFFVNNNCDVLGPREVGYGEQEDLPACRMTIDIFGYPVKLHQEVNKPHFYLQGMCLLFRKRLYEETRGFDSTFFMYCEDVDWCWRLRLLGKRLCYFPDAVVHHAKASVATRYSSQLFFWRNYYTLKMLIKNYKLYSLLWILPLYVLQNVLEMVGLLLLLQPQLIWTYVLPWYKILHSLPVILTERRWIQNHRTVSDQLLFALMYHGVGKLRHFLKAGYLVGK